MTREPLRYERDDTLARILGRAEATDDVHELSRLYRAAFQHALALLYVEHYELHPSYGNTSYRGRGIGGQTITQQCSVVSPEDREQLALWAIDDAIHQGIDALSRQGLDLLEYRSRNVPTFRRPGI